MELFDIHCHLLPGVDDGSRSMDMTMDMIQIAYEEGTRNIIFTPHYMLGKNKYEPEKLDQVFHEVSAKVYEMYPDMNLYLGNEILYEDGIIDHLKKGYIHTMNGTRYVLVEFNVRIPYRELRHAIEELTSARYWPIIAHVERYQCLVNNLDRIDEIINMGALLQMNISSVDGGFLNESKRWCRKLLKKNYITFFGTDAHNTDSRAPYTQDYIPWIEKKCDDAEWMLREAAESVINGKYIE